MQLGFDVVDALESRCRVEDCGWLDDLDVRHDEECSMSGVLEPEIVSLECRLERLRLE